MKDIATILGDDIRFQGKLHLKDSLQINGSFKGYLQTPSEVVVGPAGRVEADIDAAEVTIEGFVQGNIFASKKLEVRKKAQLIGDIRTANLQVETGAHFSGACVMD